MNTKTALTIGAILVVIVGAFFGGRSSIDCPQISVSSPADTLPETKPLVPDTVRLKNVVLRVDTVRKADTFWRAETLYREAGVFRPVVFGNRWPHSGDTALIWGQDSITLIPYDFVPQVAPTGLQEGFSGLSTGRPLFEAGAILSFGGEHQLFATVPNFLQDRRVFYWPKRIGVAYQPKGGKFGATLTWLVF